ncbi:MAG: hypothetical protein IJY65_04990 [Clostridia bacterium]|nr:hypothetical protein [Clostridia bacterium]
MAKIIQHLRGDTKSWQEHDVTVRDGELAVERTPGGNVKLKVGNGSTPYSELPYVDGLVKKSEEDVIVLGHSLDLRLGEKSTLEVKMPEVFDEDFFCMLTFDSGSTPTEFIVEDGKFVFTGGDVEGEIFIPQPMKHYTVMLWYDGRVQGCTRGVSRSVQVD